ncbi:hypothetical protein M3210_13305 [Oceanobacillus luteolus]|uniref:hypothetical protein n=1 Tax=Oceanobacillus luteolus TaxID=1274358 RepID=UPI00203E552A|nr:hypothetical protein [Oceanobacillus luteolus]MCM3741247.1 hypothetical protein [Oceanobacillus luteolus]
MRKVLYIAIFLGFILIIYSEEENVIDILDVPPTLSVEQKENQNDIDQITGVVCWGNCTNDDRSFSLNDMDDYTLNSLSINYIKEDTIFQITHEGPEADMYGYIAEIEKGDSSAGYSISIETNEFQSFNDDGIYLVVAQWFDKNEWIGCVYSLYKVEVE